MGPAASAGNKSKVQVRVSLLHKRGWLIDSNNAFIVAVLGAGRPGFTEAEAIAALGFSEARATRKVGSTGHCDYALLE